MLSRNTLTTRCEGFATARGKTQTKTSTSYAPRMSAELEFLTPNPLLCVAEQARAFPAVAKRWGRRTFRSSLDCHTFPGALALRSVYVGHRHFSTRLRTPAHLRDQNAIPMQGPSPCRHRSTLSARPVRTIELICRCPTSAGAAK